MNRTRARMAGEDPEVLQLLLEDKYRYMGPEDLDLIDYDPIPGEDVDQEDYQRALEADEIYPANVEPHQIGYEEWVTQQLALLKQRHPKATPLELLSMAMQ